MLHEARDGNLRRSVAFRPSCGLIGDTEVRYRYSGAGQRTFKQVGGIDPEHYFRDGSVTLGVFEDGSLSH